MSMEQLQSMNKKQCVCGKVHQFDAQVYTGSGVVSEIPGVLKQYHAKKVYMISDRNTYQAAGNTVYDLIQNQGIPCLSFIYSDETVEPDEKSVGSAIMHYEADCDIIVAVGSGVMNDIGKIVSAVSGKPYIIVATAPSMDGYASATSSMVRDRLRISLSSRCADVIVGDTDILCQAPLKLMKSGLGDMIAKYISICEWRIGHLITGEYYCEEVAKLVRSSLKRCVEQSSGLLKREKEAVQSVFEGLLICGAAMNYAGISRPASGVEHYVSHVLDMRGAELGIPVELHGIQCAVGTRIALEIYEKLRKITPDKEKALAYVESFDYEAWSKTLREFLGKSAESMIALEAKEGKYRVDLHRKRLDIILDNWDQILQIMDEELPSSAEIVELLDKIEAPKTLEDIGADESLLPMILRVTKDFRDKYVLSRLLFDLGVIDELV
ncbi:MAG: sn-glycerol-1-phosphate dehydrogenase [Hespellia sp.]|nr:sn-glycerol-1-phosphate dehydrogenase [Hespellia sp.]